MAQQKIKYFFALLYTMQLKSFYMQYSRQKNAQRVENY